MAFTPVTPLVTSQLYRYTIDKVYEKGYKGNDDYVAYRYEVWLGFTTKIVENGTITVVKATCYIAKPNAQYDWASPIYKPGLKSFGVKYKDTNNITVDAFTSNTEISLPAWGSEYTWTKLRDGSAVCPFANYSFYIEHDKYGVSPVNASRALDFNLYVAGVLATGTRFVGVGAAFPKEFYTLPYMEYITGATSFYNQTSLDNGTATSVPLYVSTTTLLTDNLTVGTPTIQLGLSSNGTDMDICSYVTLASGTYRATLTLTTAIQDALYRMSTTSTQMEIYYVLKTTYAGFVHYSVAKRYFYISDAEPVMYFDYSDINSVTRALTGNRKAWIKNASLISCTLDIVPKKYATIKSRYVKCGSFQSTSVSNHRINEPNGDYIEIGCIDSRGLSSSQIITPTAVYEYFKPTAIIKCSNMTGDGRVQLNFSGTFKNVTFASAENTLKLEYRYKKSSDADYCDWITIEEITAASVTSLGTYAHSLILEDLDYQETYYYQSRVTDLVNEVLSIEISGVSMPLFDWSEVDFNFNIPVTIQGSYAERIELKGEDGFWTYILWSSGVCECWGTYTGSVALSNSEGALYYSDDIVVNYPTDYSTFDNVLITGGGDTGASWVRTTEGTASDKVAFRVVGAASGNVSVTVPIHAWGFWR